MEFRYKKAALGRWVTPGYLVENTAWSLRVLVPGLALPCITGYAGTPGHAPSSRWRVYVVVRGRAAGMVAR